MSIWQNILNLSGLPECNSITSHFCSAFNAINNVIVNEEEIVVSLEERDEVIIKIEEQDEVIIKVNDC